MRKNDGYSECANILLPLPPFKKEAELEMEIYVRFMRSMRHISNAPQNRNVLAAIQFIAGMMQIPDTQVSQILVGLGLRAPRMAFPQSYLRFIDKSEMRGVSDFGSIGEALRELQDHWQDIRQEKFLCFGLTSQAPVGRSA